MSTSPSSRAPSRARFALLVFVFVYPVVTALLYVIAALPLHLTLWQRSLLLAPIMVFLMVYVIIPFIQTRLRHLM